MTIAKRSPHRTLEAFALTTLLLLSTLAACQVEPPTAAPAATSASPPAASPTLEVPVYARDANQLGSLEFVVVYEPTLLEVLEVKRGSLADNALIEYDNETPGRLWTGIVDANGINGDGPVALISFRPLEKSETPSPLVLEKVSAHNVSTLLDIPAWPSSGQLTISGQRFTSPEVAFVHSQ